MRPPSFVGVGTAVALYPVVKGQNEGVALGLRSRASPNVTRCLWNRSGLFDVFVTLPYGLKYSFGLATELATENRVQNQREVAAFVAPLLGFVPTGDVQD
jgi:hypothetical protein